MIKGPRGASPTSDMRQAPRVTIRRPEAGGSTRHRLPVCKKLMEQTKGVIAERHVQIDFVRVVDYNVFCVSIPKLTVSNGGNDGVLIG